MKITKNGRVTIFECGKGGTVPAPTIKKETENEGKPWLTGKRNEGGR